MKVLVVLFALFTVSLSFEGCSGNGVSLNGTCLCFPEYAYDDCSYRRRDAITANLLEWILGAVGIAGVGMIYLGYLAVGVPHLLVRLCCCSTGGALIYATKKGKFNSSGGYGSTSLMRYTVVWGCYSILTLGMLVWYLVCGIQIATGIPDINSVAPYG